MKDYNVKKGTKEDDLRWAQSLVERKREVKNFRDPKYEYL